MGYQLQLLSEASSGATAYESTEAKKRRYDLIIRGRLVYFAPPRASTMTAEAERVFGLTNSGYLLHLGSSGPPLIVNLSPSAQLKNPWFVVAPGDAGTGFACSP